MDLLSHGSLVSCLLSYIKSDNWFHRLHKYLPHAFGVEFYHLVTPNMSPPFGFLKNLTNHQPKAPTQTAPGAGPTASYFDNKSSKLVKRKSRSKKGSNDHLLLHAHQLVDSFNEVIGPASQFDDIAPSRYPIHPVSTYRFSTPFKTSYFYSLPEWIRLWVMVAHLAMRGAHLTGRMYMNMVRLDSILAWKDTVQQYRDLAR